MKNLKKKKNEKSNISLRISVSLLSYRIKKGMSTEEQEMLPVSSFALVKKVT